MMYIFFMLNESFQTSYLKKKKEKKNFLVGNWPNCTYKIFKP